MSSEPSTAEQPSKLVRSFTPFTANELAVLNQVVDLCERMRKSRLMEVTYAEVTVPARRTADAELLSHFPELTRADEVFLAEPDAEARLNVREDDIGAFLQPFRQLYQKRDHTQVNRVRNMLAQHARDKDTPEGDQTVEDLKTWKADYQRALRESPMGTMYETEPGAKEPVEYTAEDIIKNWLNGVFFHPDLEAAGKVAGPDRGMHAFALIGAVQHVAGYMLELGELARAIVSEPALRAS